jgi:hypothetical protein
MWRIVAVAAYRAITGAKGIRVTAKSLAQPATLL